MAKLVWPFATRCPNAQAHHNVATPYMNKNITACISVMSALDPFYLSESNTCPEVLTIVFAFPLENSRSVWNSESPLEKAKCLIRLRREEGVQTVHTLTATGSITHSTIHSFHCATWNVLASWETCHFPCAGANNVVLSTEHAINAAKKICKLDDHEPLENITVMQLSEMDLKVRAAAMCLRCVDRLPICSRWESCQKFNSKVWAAHAKSVLVTRLLAPDEKA